MSEELQKRAMAAAAEVSAAGLQAELGDDLNGKQIRRAVEIVLQHSVVPIRVAALAELSADLVPVAKSFTDRAEQVSGEVAKAAFEEAGAFLSMLAKELTDVATTALEGE